MDQSPYSGNAYDFVTRPGSDLLKKAREFEGWLKSRINLGLLPYGKTVVSRPSSNISLKMLDGVVKSGINFSSQDYLSLASHPKVIAAAIDAIDKFGVHSAGSTALAGTMEEAAELKNRIGELLLAPHVTLYPTGWGAGYGIIRALIRPTDHICMDVLAHNCIQEGANASTKNVHLYRHNSLEHLRKTIESIREKDSHCGILVITESLFSMDSDAPDIKAFQELASEYNALLLVDAAHDLGSIGPNGTGNIGIQNMLGKVDIVMGSFSKTFASNGGFIASSKSEIAEYLRFLSPTNTFSNALSPSQIAVVNTAFSIVSSDEGNDLRKKLNTSITALRSSLNDNGLETFGTSSPIVPVHIGGSDAIGRIATRNAAELGVLVNLVEYPAVSKNSPRFRVQMMANHHPMDMSVVAKLLAQSIEQAKQEAKWLLEKSQV